MRTKLILSALLAPLILPSLHAQTVDPTPTPTPAVQAERPSEGGKRDREFQGDDLGQVLRLLARQAKINLMVGDTVKGLVNVRLENISAIEAIEVIARQYQLSMTKDEKGVYYLNPPGPADAALDLLAKPETAYRIAAYKHNLYTALIKEGFTPEDSLKIVVASEPSSLK